MDQSDSQDFEFDISDLEVEGSGSSAPRAGENVSNDQASTDAPLEEEVADNEVVSEDSQTIGVDAVDDDLAGFDLGGIPDASGGSSVTIDSSATAEPSVAPGKSEAVSESSVENVTDQVSRIEPEVPETAEAPPSMRQLGNDDLGANIFEEIDDSSDTSSFADVLDGLMDEVSEFEVGTAIDDPDGENAEAVENGLPDPFKFDDPDDSVTAQSGVNPKPFEPSKDDPLGESVEVESEPVAEVISEEVEQMSAPDPVPAPVVEQPEPVAAAPVEPVMQQPASPQPAAPAQSAVEPPKREIPSDFEIPADNGVAAASEALKDEAPVPAEEEPVVGSGTENVLFDALAEEPLTESSALEMPANTVSPEPVTEKSPPAAEPIARAPESKAIPEVPENQPSEAPAPEEASEIAEVEEPVDEVAIDEPSELEEEIVPESSVRDSKENVLFNASEGEEVSDDVAPEPVEDQVEQPEPVAEVSEKVAEIPTEPEEEIASESGASDPQEDVLFNASEVEEVGDDLDLESIAKQLEEVADSEAEEASNADTAEKAVAEPVAEEIAKPEEEVAPEVNSGDSEKDSLFDETEVEEVVDEVDLQAIEDQLEVEDPAEEEASETVEKAEEPDAAPAAIESVDSTEAAESEESTSPEAIAEDSSGETSADDDEADAAAILESVEAIFEEEEEEAVEEAEVSAPAPAAAVPELEVLEEEEDEPETEPEGSPANEIPGLTEVPEEEEEVQEVASGLTEVEEEEEEVAEAMPSAEDLLMSAASLLNGDAGPAADASSLLDEEDEEEGLAAMPSPADLMSEAADSDSGLSEVEEDEEVVSMPDPSALMSAASDSAPEGLAIVDDEEEEELAVIEEIEAPEEELEEPEFSGNIADNAGELPPPPPAPVEIIDDDPMEEDVEEILPDTPALEPVAEDDSGIEDPFANDSLLEGLDSDLDESVDDLSSESGELDESQKGDEEEPPEEEGKPVEKKVAEVVEMPQPSLLWRITHSMTIAAGLVLMGFGWVSFTWKQEIREYMEGRDFDGTALLTHIRQVGDHALDGFNEDGLYRMQWLDTDIRRVAKNEIRMHSLVGAQLREDLYEPVFESVLEEKFGYDENSYTEAMEFAHANYPEKIGSSPVRPWSTLYRLSSPKDEILPLRIVYRVTREDEESDWNLSGVKVSGYKADLEWATGRPRHDFDESAQDVDSEEFAEMVAEYKAASAQFVASMNTLKKSLEAEEAMLAMENKQRRERVVMSLSQGAFFSGIAILGEDSDASQGVTMVVTEVHQDVGMLKGVFKISGGEGVSKHFIGRIDFKKSQDGLESGVLSLTTIAFKEDLTNGEVGETPPFFSPRTISHMQLKTDGFRLEGDAADIALRMTRHM